MLGHAPMSLKQDICRDFALILWNKPSGRQLQKRSIPMKRLIAWFIVLVASSGCELRPPSAGHSSPGTTSGGAEQSATSTTAEATLEYIQGGRGTFSMTDLKGRVVLLDVCALWSPANRALIPELNRLHDEEQAAGLTVIGLAVDANARAGLTAEWQELGARYPIVATPRASLLRLTSVRSVPARLLYDRKGQLRKQYPGEVSPDVLRADVGELIKE
jgi:thiol-disulfide isomerase/thioredoxin